MISVPFNNVGINPKNILSATFEVDGYAQFLSLKI